MDSFDSSIELGLVLVARLCLGFFFLPSALGKITGQRRFIQSVNDYQILPERAAIVFGLLLPWMELTIAIGLILGIALPIMGIATSLLLTCFIAAVTINLRRGREIRCNCYGIADTKTISWGTVARNLLLLLLAAIVVGLAPNILQLDSWLAFWQTDRLVVSTLDSSLALLLLLAFCLVTIYLSEWTLDIHYRISRLGNPRS